MLQKQNYKCKNNKEILNALQVFGSLQSKLFKAPRWAWRVFQPSKWICEPPTPQFNGEFEMREF